MKPQIILSIIFLGIGLNAISQEIIHESFDNGLIAPDEWIFSISNIYTTTPYAGTLAPALKFENTGQFIETKTFSNASSVSFFARGINTENSALTIYFQTKFKWYLLDSITEIPTQKGSSVFSRALPDTCTKLKFSYFKTKGNISFDDLIVTASNTSIFAENSFDDETIKIWPNPVSESLNIKLPIPYSNQKTIIYLTSITGKTLSWWNLSNKTNISLQLPRLNNGLYIISITTLNKTISKKIFVKNQLKIEKTF
jgi:hypothetical protein